MLNMNKIHKHIEIVRTSLKSLSSMSQESSENILEVLERNFISVGISLVNNRHDLERLISSRPDLVFLGMEFIYENPDQERIDEAKIWISDYLDSRGIAYTGSAKIAHVLERNKHLAKQQVLEANLKTSAYGLIKQDQFRVIDDISLEFPLFVKPANRGGGLGIDSDSVVHNYQELNAKASSISHEFKSDVLIEEYLAGREFSVAIMRKVGFPELMVMPIELVAPADEFGNRILGSKIKTANVEQVLAVADSLTKDRVNKLALGVFVALKARDYGRIDIRLDAFGAPNFLEANLIPSLISGYGSFPKACELNINLAYEPMILNIVNLGLERTIDRITVIEEPINEDGEVFQDNNIILEPA